MKSSSWPAYSLGKIYVMLMSIEGLNSNSLLTKFDSLLHIINKNIDVWLWFLKPNFSFSWFLFSVCKISLEKLRRLLSFKVPCKLGRNPNGADRLLYIREDITSALLNSALVLQRCCIRMKWSKKKWLFYCLCDPQRNLIAAFLEV